MGYGICRVQKVKAAAVGSMQYHNDRLPGEHSNPNIDHSKRGDNAEFIKHGSYRAEVNDRIERFRKSDRKVRKDAVVLVEGVMTASPEFFEGKSRDEVMAFFRDGFDFVKSEVGEGNMVHFTVHMDESTPHAHFGFTPIKDGTLSWKNYFDGRDALRGWQDRFFEKVSKPWGLERGEKDTGRTHKDAAQMRRDAERELHEVQGQVDVKRTELDATNRDLAESTERLECLRQEIEELEPAAQTVAEGVRTLWKARSNGSREEELGRDIEGLRTRISDLSSQIADVDRRADEIERGLPILRARCASLGERFEFARAGVVKALEGLREVPNIVSEWAQELARKMGKHLFDPNSIDYLSREMREAARPLEALRRSHEAPTRSRGHGAR
jgi:chaperonin cofactor prefoldin